MMFVFHIGGNSISAAPGVRVVQSSVYARYWFNTKALWCIGFCGKCMNVNIMYFIGAYASLAWEARYVIQTMMTAKEGVSASTVALVLTL